MNAFNDEEIIVSGIGKFFYEEKEFSRIIKVVKNIKRIDITKLDGIVEWFNSLLHSYQDITKMSNNKIHQLCILLQRQISKLKNIIEE